MTKGQDRPVVSRARNCLADAPWFHASHLRQKQDLGGGALRVAAMWLGLAREAPPNSLSRCSARRLEARLTGGGGGASKFSGSKTIVFRAARAA